MLTPNYQMDLIGYEWELKLVDKTVPGIFVEFQILEGNITSLFPLCKGSDKFAFCPRNFLNDFKKEVRPFTKAPKYILIFSRSDIKGLKLLSL